MGDIQPKKIDKARVKEFSKIANLKYNNYGLHFASMTVPNYVRYI